MSRVHPGERIHEHYTQGPRIGGSPDARGLEGKRVAMVTFSLFPADPRPRRALESLLKEGMLVDLVCLGDGRAPTHECSPGLDVVRIPIKQRRGGKISYAYQYSSFIFMSAAIMALRALRRRYDLVYIHNMPDVLVASALIPKVLGAKVILDQHDPMPELMTTIFNLDNNSFGVRLMTWLEKWSIARANLVITVNVACKRIFASRSCHSDKIGVVMNAPDGEIFGFRRPRSTESTVREVPSKAYVLMYHGSIVERNGLDLAVEALARVREAVPQAELRIYGRETGFLTQVMDDAARRGLRDCVHYLGPKSLEGLVTEIDQCDVGIIPNKRNAFTDINTPTRIFEYLALGKPVIAPRTRGILDYFGRDSLFFFESGDVGDLARQIEFVAHHPEVALRTVELGQEVFQAHTWAEERRMLLSLVSGLLKGVKPQ
jgi:glycosyltransferase involved in cell wall biosynthesis